MILMIPWRHLHLMDNAFEKLLKYIQYTIFLSHNRCLSFPKGPPPQSSVSKFQSETDNLLRVGGSLAAL